MREVNAGPAEQAARHHSLVSSLARTGYASIALFVGTVGAWAFYMPLSGAVIASATFVVENNVRRVQHPSGGVVTELAVREGHAVEAGDVLIRLDPTATRTSLQIISRQLDEARARAARLVAERDGQPRPPFPQELTSRANDAEVADLLASEARMLQARAAMRAGSQAQLGKRIAQLRAEISGLAAQDAAKGREAVAVGREHAAVRSLFERNMAQLARLTPLERDVAQIEGTRGALQSQIAQAEGKIAETELQILQLDQDWRNEVLKELRDVEARVAELTERRVAAEDQFRRLDIRAPVGGTVHQLAVTTIGGVLNPAEPLMLIVPTGEALHLDARIAPSDYDQVKLGQEARVKLHAFDQRLSSDLVGRVSRIAPDASRDQQGASHYVIRVSLTADALKQLGTNEIKAGMQADVFIRTSDRTPASYLVKPLADQIARAFRER